MTNRFVRFPSKLRQILSRRRWWFILTRRMREPESKDHHHGQSENMSVHSGLWINRNCEADEVFKFAAGLWENRVKKFTFQERFSI